MFKSSKIEYLPPNVFRRLEERKNHARQQGKDIIDCGTANPSGAPPAEVVWALQRASQVSENSHYAPTRGISEFRQEIANWYRVRFGVDIDPDTEVHTLLGSKEGLFDISLTYLGQRDVALIPDPSFPTYHDGAYMAGADIYRLPLRKENHYLPRLDNIPLFILKRARVLFLNYPHNPTGAMAPPEFMREVISFAKEHDIIVCYDNAFSELTFDGNKAPSFLEYEGAKDVGIELFTFSKAFNMSGWRLAFAVGNRHIIGSLVEFHAEAHTGMFPAIQWAGVTALKDIWPTSFLAEQRADYQRKRDYALNKFAQIGWPVDKPAGAIYLWVPSPHGTTCEEFADMLLDNYGLLVAPGIGFGDTGHGFIRISMTCKLEDFKRGIDYLCDAIQMAAKPTT